ncbi:unnamed protein product [Arctogadus glacialis]
MCHWHQVSSGAVTVTVTPEVEVLMGAAASLPCTFNAAPSSATVVEWFVDVGQGVRKRVAYQTLNGAGGTDEGTPLSGRVTMGQDFTLTIANVQPKDQLPLVCQVSAGLAGGSEVLSQTGMLSIQKASYENAGQYMCVGAVATVPGLTAMGSVNITVKGAPIIETPVNGLVAKQGEMVTLKCSAHGYPAPQFTWKPSGKESVSVEGPRVVSTLTLEASVEVMKEGVTCEVSNEHGKDSKLFSVSIKEARGNDADRAAGQQQGGSSTVVVAVVVCVLLLLAAVALIYFLNKSGKLPCGKKTTKEVSAGEVNNDIVVEMKTEKSNEQAGLLNKGPATEQ